MRTFLLSSCIFIPRWFPGITVNAITFLVIAMMENFVLVQNMENVYAENVFVIQSGIVQVRN